MNDENDYIKILMVDQGEFGDVLNPSLLKCLWNVLKYDDNLFWQWSDPLMNEPVCSGQNVLTAVGNRWCCLLKILLILSHKNNQSLVK